MIALSGSELKAAFYRMLTGSGVNVGAAEDLSGAAVLGARFGLPVCEELLSALGCKHPEVEIRDDKMIWQGSADMLALLSSIDFLQAGCVVSVHADAVAMPYMAAVLALYLAPEMSFRIQAGARHMMTHQSRLYDLGYIQGSGLKISMGAAPDGWPIPFKTGPIMLKAVIWEEIGKLAARSYVPATKASRARGAGAGLTDYD